MSTFLELVQILARESGTLAGGSTLPTVTSAAGRVQKLVGWVRDAWVNIQNERSDWPWMEREFVSALAIGQRRYIAADFDLTRFAQWKRDEPAYSTMSLWDPDIGQADEGEIRQVSYDLWRQQYGRGVSDPNRPILWAPSLTQELCVGPFPDKAYVIAGSYRLLPQVLAADTDVPELPVQYHKAIIWEALKLLGISDQAAQQATDGMGQYMQIRAQLNRDYLPEITIGGGPLA